MGRNTFPFFPDAPGAPGAPGFPDAPGAPGFPDAPGAPGAPGFPDAPGAPDAPDAPGAPGVPSGPDSTAVPFVTRVVPIGGGAAPAKARLSALVRDFTREFLLIVGGTVVWFDVRTGDGFWFDVRTGDGASGLRLAMAPVMARARVLASVEVLRGAVPLAGASAAESAVESPRVLIPAVAFRAPRAFLMDAVKVLASERVLRVGGGAAPRVGRFTRTVLMARVSVAASAVVLTVGRAGGDKGVGPLPLRRRNTRRAISFLFLFAAAAAASFVFALARTLPIMFWVKPTAACRAGSSLIGPPPKGIFTAARRARIALRARCSASNASAVLWAFFKRLVLSAAPARMLPATPLNVGGAGMGCVFRLNSLLAFFRRATTVPSAAFNLSVFCLRVSSGILTNSAFARSDRGGGIKLSVYN